MKKFRDLTILFGMPAMVWVLVGMAVTLEGAPLGEKADGKVIGRAEAPIQAIDTTRVPDGQYLFTKRGAVVTLSPMTLLVPVLSGSPAPGPNPNPIPVPIPDPGPLEPFQEQVRVEAKKALEGGGTPTTGAGISSVYSLAADALNKIPPTLTTANCSEFVRMGTAKVLESRGEEREWAAFASGMDQTITTARARGALKTEKDFHKVFRDTARGIDAAVGNKMTAKELIGIDPATAGILGNIDLAKLIELIKLIMELFKMFTP